MKNTLLVTLIVFLAAVVSAARVWAYTDSVKSVSAPEKPYVLSTEPADSFIDKHFKKIPVFSDSIRMDLGGEFRYRMENRRDYDFRRTRHDNNAFSLFRTRFNSDTTFGKWGEFFIEFQDAHEANAKTQFQGNAFVDYFDLRQAFFQLKWPEGDSRRLTGMKLVDHVIEHSKFRAGRQELYYGDQRFIGVFDWSNVSRTFDALRYIYDDLKKRSVDLFWAQVVKVHDHEMDATDHGNNLLGVYWSEKWIPDNVIDTFMFVRLNDKIRYLSEQPPVPGGLRSGGPLAEFTLGNRWKGKYKRLDYGTEYALQFGRRGGDDITAVAFHQELGYTFPISCKLRPNVEYNFGSGDHNRRDGHYNIFDNLFPTNHDKYGLIDFASLQNMNDVRVGCSVEPIERLKLASSFHFFYLADSASPWFSSGLSVIRAGNSSASDTLGKEFDMVAWWQLSKHMKYSMGYSHWFSGPFVKDTGPHDDANFFYVQTQVNW